MPYVVIEDFKSGLDRRKAQAASPQGSLQVLTNAHITRGGEIEKRLAFVPTHSVPGTFGLAGANGQLYVFSSSEVALPSGIDGQVLSNPSGAAMTKIVDAEFFEGKIFTLARYADGKTLPFYDAVRVEDWAETSGLTVAGKTPTTVLTVKSKVYAAFESTLAFSAISAPRDWGGGDGSGEGFITMSNQAAGFETLTALGRYQGYMAVFARRNTQIWYLDSDPIQNAQRQVIPNVGTFAPESVVNFGDIDVIFLSDTGVRSLKARDASNQAGVSDIGTPIDGEIIEYMHSLTEAQKAASCAVMEPIDGRYLCAIGERVYAFSYFPTSKISSWSRYDPGFTVDKWVAMDGALYARSGDTIYTLGGSNGQTYDDCEVEVELPYIDGRQVATWKKFTGLDLICTGEWAVYINTDPNVPDVWTKIAIIKDSTISTAPRLKLDMTGESPMIKLRFLNQRSGPATLSKVVVHFAAEQAN